VLDSVQLDHLGDCAHRNRNPAFLPHPLHTATRVGLE
jgi:hypothetical protein